MDVVGIEQGYHGLILDRIIKMDSSSVSGIINQGGTILKSARSESFRTKEGRAKAAEVIKKHKIDALVVIGGDGTFTGARIFTQEHNIPIVGVPGTIDNDRNNFV